jgi:hypothetical protein
MADGLKGFFGANGGWRLCLIAPRRKEARCQFAYCQSDLIVPSAMTDDRVDDILEIIIATRGAFGKSLLTSKASPLALLILATFPVLLLSLGGIIASSRLERTKTASCDHCHARLLLASLPSNAPVSGGTF